MKYALILALPALLVIVSAHVSLLLMKAKRLTSWNTVVFYCVCFGLGGLALGTGIHFSPELTLSGKVVIALVGLAAMWFLFWLWTGLVLMNIFGIEKCHVSLMRAHFENEAKYTAFLKLSQSQFIRATIIRIAGDCQNSDELLSKLRTDETLTGLSFPEVYEFTDVETAMLRGDTQLFTEVVAYMIGHKRVRIKLSPGVTSMAA
ncbi:MAG: hypothetical protein V4519_00025 [Patescibacteria group bacterium]